VKVIISLFFWSCSNWVFLFILEFRHFQT